MPQFVRKTLIILLTVTSFYAWSDENTNSVPEAETEICRIEVFSEGVDINEMHSIIENYNGYISIIHTQRILENSIQYRAYVRKRLKESGLPPCLEYLPIIESDYKPTAKPPKGSSMGIWQFMPNSVSPYMELSEYIDERRDPWISTDAALKKLAENYKTFGDWLLALAAYNCGSGAVNRALKQSEEKTYTALCEKDLIPDHAKAYVKRFLALSDKIMNAETYGYSELKAADEIPYMDLEYFFYYDFDYVTITGPVSLSVIAQEFRIDCEILKSLNLSLVKEIIPEGKTYRLRVPSGMKCEIVNRIAEN